MCESACICVRMNRCENGGSMWKYVEVCISVCEYEYEWTSLNVNAQICELEL